MVQIWPQGQCQEPPRHLQSIAHFNTADLQAFTESLDLGSAVKPGQQPSEPLTLTLPKPSVEGIEGWFRSHEINPNDARHALQVFVALVVTCVLNLSDGMAEAFDNKLAFVGITAAVVIENTLGSVLQKAFFKVLGTFSGGLAAWAVSRFTDVVVGFDDFPSKSAIFIICVPLVAAGTVFHKNRIQGHAGYVVFLLTWVSIMFDNWREDSLDEPAIFLKTLNVLIGSCLATLCTCTIFPVRASKLLQRSFLESTDELVDFFSKLLDLYTDHVFGDGKCDDEEDALVDGLQSSTSEMMRNLCKPRKYIDHAKHERRCCHRTRGADIDWNLLLEKRDEAGWAMIALLSTLDSGTAQTSLCVKMKKDIKHILTRFRACMYGIGGMTVQQATTEQVAPHLGALAAQIALFACKAHEEESKGLPKQTLVELSCALVSIMCKTRLMFLACNPSGGPLLNSEFRKHFPKVPAGSSHEAIVSAVMGGMGFSRLHMFEQDESDEAATDSKQLSRRAAKRLLCIMRLADFDGTGAKGASTGTLEPRVDSSQSMSSAMTVKMFDKHECTPRSFAGACGELSKASTCCPSVGSQEANGSRAVEHARLTSELVLPPLPKCTTLQTALSASPLPPPDLPPPPCSVLHPPSLSSSLTLPPSSGTVVDESVVDWKGMAAAMWQTMRDDLREHAEKQVRMEEECAMKHTSEMNELRIQIEKMHSSNEQIMKWFEKLRKKSRVKRDEERELNDSSKDLTWEHLS